ncbi:MAG: response regulator [Chloroflexi bacterium]|nr:response regulator [Chloroflexota bacterium]
MSNTNTRILVVDDDATALKLVDLLLRHEGYQVLCAETGEQALTLARREPPDLAILDVMLPGMDGYAVCRRLRQLAATALMPILMLTAQCETRDKLAGFDAGADDYLTKPFEPPELTLRVRALLARTQTPDMKKKSIPRGKLWAVFGAKGGVGKTTLAVNLAVALAKQPNTRVALVDADLSFGDVAAHLNLFPSRTIMDLTPRLYDLDADLLAKVLIRHESGVHVLLGPYRPEDAERITPEAFQMILNALTEMFDYVIADCPSNYDERTLTLLEHTDQILMVLTPEIGPVKNTSTFIELAAALDIPSERIQIILNRANSEVGIAAPEIERALQKQIPLRLMSGGRSVVLSVNRGVPLLMEQPQHPFSLQITRIAELVRAPVLAGAARSF